MNVRRPYAGRTRKLLIAIDVGTTYSGVSYSILDPGLVPQVYGVNRFPAQEHAGGDSKISSVLFYDRYGQVRAVGAETLQEDVILRASDEGWVRSEWFKLHLRPRASDPSQELSTLPPLPPNKTVVDVFADMLEYLIDCAKVYIREAHPGGANLWSSVGQNIDFVLTHPNGWEGRQQSLMRLAAVQAKLIPDTDAGKARVTFVSEGEASLHFCLNKGLIAKGTMANKGIIIVDAGGGTIDLSAYKQAKIGDKTSYAECAAAQCLFKGSIMVKRSAHTYVKDRLRGSRYLERATDIVDTFDRTTKLTFKNAKTPSYVKFGGMNDNDPAYNIRGGRLVIPGTDMAKFFQPSVTSITQAVHRQRGEASLSGPPVFLVGGFAASSYLYTELQTNLAPLGMQVFRPDSHTNKAVAEGGVLYVLDHRVSARVARFAYGTCGNTSYSQANPEHARRQSKSFVEGTLVTETQEFERGFVRMSIDLQDLQGVQRVAIWVYRGPLQNPQWTDVDADNYGFLCHVSADMSAATRNLPLMYSRRGDLYYKINFNIVLLFGLTELKAQMSWLENVSASV
ncbi:hypothetical protein K525DRAFT_208879 [Schizophyllum commune Loenen D]|nr:hypothetical protein K525DRAFT_208879 [Schizophyllum commune Loenen D]